MYHVLEGLTKDWLCSPVYFPLPYHTYTSRAAGGGSFQDKKPREDQKVVGTWLAGWLIDWQADRLTIVFVRVVLLDAHVKYVQYRVCTCMFSLKMVATQQDMASRARRPAPVCSPKHFLTTHMLSFHPFGSFIVYWFRVFQHLDVTFLCLGGGWAWRPLPKWRHTPLDLAWFSKIFSSHLVLSSIPVVVTVNVLEELTLSNSFLFLTLLFL